MSYIKDPNEISKQSFKIIQDKINQIIPGYQFNSQIEEKIIKRAIHTTADFDYLKNLKFTHKVI